MTKHRCRTCRHCKRHPKGMGCADIEYGCFGPNCVKCQDAKGGTLPYWRKLR